MAGSFRLDDMPTHTGTLTNFAEKRMCCDDHTCTCNCDYLWIKILIVLMFTLFVSSPICESSYMVNRRWKPTSCVPRWYATRLPCSWSGVHTGKPYRWWWLRETMAQTPMNLDTKCIWIKHVCHMWTRPKLNVWKRLTNRQRWQHPGEMYHLLSF